MTLCFVKYRTSSYVGDVYISGTEQNRKLNLSMQTHLTHINTILEYCHASVIIISKVK